MEMNNLKYLTVKIEGMTEDGANTVGTGFFIRLNDIPLIATASHVVEDTSNFIMNLRYKVGKHIAMLKFPCDATWTCMPQYDLACCKVDEIEKEFFKITGFNLFYRCLTEEHILSEKDMEKTAILSEVLMIGYPSGASASVWEYPIFQKGNLASAPGDKSDRKYIDITTVGGSSGSPLLLLGDKPKLLGIMSEALLETPLSSANLGIYREAFHLPELMNALNKTY